jgi:site-specific DNA-methyltransferase (adenine-specific)
MNRAVDIYIGDALKVLPTITPRSVHCCVTSPPYFGLRDYGEDGQIGLEQTPEDYVAKLVEVFRAVREVLRDDGTVFLNLGDSYATQGAQKPNSGLSALADRYAPRKNPRNPNRDDCGEVPRTNKKIPPGLKQKDLIGIPWRVAFALQADGWYLRQDIIWAKNNPMPESVRDRCTKAHEYIFLLSKQPKYYYDHEAIKEPASQPTRVRADRFGGNKYTSDTTMHSDGSIFTGGKTRNKRSVWNVNAKPFKGAHFATFPPDLIRPCILAGCPEGGVVLDPFMGSGTTGIVSIQNSRQFVGIELNPKYVDEIALPRLAAEVGKYKQVELWRATGNG